MKRSWLILGMLCLVLVCCVGAAFAASVQDEITLPNSEAEAIVRHAARLGDDEPITKEAVVRIQILDLSRTGLVNIDFLSDFTSLERLYLRNNAISDIAPLAGLHSLKSLDLRNNSIPDITALAELTALRSLYLSGNGICDISALAALTSLEGCI